MILDIVTYPAASLKEKCVPVTEITDEIRQLAADMLETMYEAPGVPMWRCMQAQLWSPGAPIMDPPISCSMGITQISGMSMVTAVG